jgi:hypothetical protein
VQKAVKRVDLMANWTVLWMAALMAGRKAGRKVATWVYSMAAKWAVLTDDALVDQTAGVTAAKTASWKVGMMAAEWVGL